MQDFQGRVAVVTGAASGIGLASARAFARLGMKVALLDVREADLAAAAKAVAELGAPVLSLATDVADAAAVDAARDQILAAFGKVHLLMNNAAVFIRGHDVASVGDDVWDWLLGVNLYGPIHCVRSFLPGMQAHGEGGHIVNTASISGFAVGNRKNGVYATSKFALVGFSEALAHELTGTGVGVSVIFPAAVATEFYENSAQIRGDLGGPNLYPTAPPDTAAGMSPDEVAARLVHGIRNNAFYIPTHSATRDLLEARHRNVMAGFDAAARFEDQS
jgi:NAD(P)-dependent dehydrogenase (short-subunit alcohol dehydrogenase family)